MSASELDWVVDSGRNVLLESFASTREARTPVVTNGDSLPITVRVSKPGTNGNEEVDLTGKTIRVGIGQVAGDPVNGTWTLTHSGNTTSALAYNATAAQVETALEALASISGVSVVALTGGGYRIAWDAVGAVTAVTADTSALYPTTSAFVETSVTGDASTRNVLVVAMEVDPAAYIELTTALPSASATITQIQTGVDADTPEIQRYKLDPEPYGGTYTITIDGETTSAIDFDAATSTVKAAVEALTSIGSGKVTVTGAFPEYTLTFDGSLADVGAITIDSSALNVPVGRTGNIEMRTAKMLELLDGGASKRAQVEIVVHTTSTGRGWTAAQVPIRILNDLVKDSPASVTPAPGYLTANDTIQFLPDITSTIGGTSSDLDSIVTVDTTVGKVVSFLFGLNFAIYQLKAGTTAESSPTIIRPDDYAASTNEKIWTLVGIQVNDLEAGGTGNFQGTLESQSDITAGDDVFIDGTNPALLTDVGSTAAMTALGFYSLSGDLYWKSSGDPAVKLT